MGGLTVFKRSYDQQVHGDNIIACSAVEVADRIAVIEGLEEEQKSSAALRCARIYAECNRKPGKLLLRMVKYRCHLPKPPWPSLGCHSAWVACSYSYHSHLLVVSVHLLVRAIK